MDFLPVTATPPSAADRNVSVLNFHSVDDVFRGLRGRLWNDPRTSGVSVTAGILCTILLNVRTSEPQSLGRRTRKLTFNPIPTNDSGKPSQTPP